MHFAIFTTETKQSSEASELQLFLSSDKIKTNLDRNIFFNFNFQSIDKDY